MQNLPINLVKSLEQRIENNSLRLLKSLEQKIDFSSNDYLGYAASEVIFKKTFQILANYPCKNGSTGSRLLTGNHELFKPAEDFVAHFHKAETALFFNSGYDANVGFFSSVPKKEDLVLYDELAHASIRDGIKISNAKAYKFRHNDPEDLRTKLKSFRKLNSRGEIYVVTESVFSMDGDSPDLPALCEIAEEFHCFLIIDEAHGIGVHGKNGQGLVQELELQEKIFARIVTFGKALGLHGAAILGSKDLRDYLINFCRSFIYTTALPPHSIAGILSGYQYLSSSEGVTFEVSQLQEKIRYFNSEVEKKELSAYFLPSNSAIHCCIVPGNERVKKLSEKLFEKEFDVKPILSPTVPQGKERLRTCLHSYNTTAEIDGLLKEIANFME